MCDESADDVMALLSAAGRGEPHAVSQLAEVVYAELRRLAHAILKSGDRHQTLRTTALVNEAWLRLAGGRDPSYESSAHFYRTAARAMRTVLIDYARARGAEKRGGSWRPTPLDDVVSAIEVDQVDLLALDEALQRLELLSPRRCQVVELRFFGGLSIEQTARLLGVSHGTVENDWSFARLWLHNALAGSQP